MEDLKSRALRGGFARMCAQAANFVLRVGSLMVLARLLTPREYGLFGMVTAITGVFALFRDAGLSTVTIQRPTISDGQLSALFWLNLLVGLLLALLCVGAAPLLVAFYGEPQLFWVTIVTGCAFPLNAAGIQHSALLQRHMRFGALAAIDVAAQICSVTMGIAMALLGFGYWALVAAALTLPAVTTTGTWSATRWVPGRPRGEGEIGSMIRFGGTLTLNSLVVYVAYNVDKLLIGRVWGADALGLYGRAYQLVNIPTENLNSAVGGVAVSALSRLQDDPGRFKNYFLRAYSLVLAMTIPVTTACACFAEDIIVVVLGQQWTNAAGVFTILAPTIVAFGVLNPMVWLLFSTGRVSRSLHMALVIAPTVILGYVIGLPYGPLGVALGYSAAMTILIAPMITWGLRDTGITVRGYVAVLGPPFLSSLCGAAVGLVVGRLIADALPAPQRLALEVGVLSVTYVIVLLSVGGQRSFYYDLARDLLTSWRRQDRPHPSRSDAGS
ncbi:MAG TPA: lipopolysaccharide biosynthesis protein [Gemmatimonadales bacterium]|nr:lipopolysaccharide biosynthesis protein [Gemmatimonadales bacterium]